MKNFAYGSILSFVLTSILHITAVDFGMKLNPIATVGCVLLGIGAFLAVNAVEE